MFGIDVHSLEVLVPSLVGVIGISAVMVWAFIKVRHLMNEDEKK
ncbi:hypothetical protein [Nitrincola tapanii]|nr:hypothetical protein [Nitrincola tapanii]